MGQDTWVTLVRTKKQKTVPGSDALTIVGGVKVNFSDLEFLSGEYSDNENLRFPRNYHLQGFLGGEECTRCGDWPRPMVDVVALRGVTTDMVDMVHEYHQKAYNAAKSDPSNTIEQHPKYLLGLNCYHDCSVAYPVAALLNFDYDQVATMVDEHGNVKDTNPEGLTYRQLFAEGINKTTYFEFLDELKKLDWEFVIFCMY